MYIRRKPDHDEPEYFNEGVSYVVYGMILAQDAIKIAATWSDDEDGLYFYDISDFDVVDNRLSKYWVYEKKEDNFYIGIPVLSFGNSEIYLVKERGHIEFHEFSRIKRLIDLEFIGDRKLLNAMFLQEQNFQCPKCFDAWAVICDGAEVVQCPSCQELLDSREANRALAG